MRINGDEDKKFVKALIMNMMKIWKEILVKGVVETDINLPLTW